MVVEVWLSSIKHIFITLCKSRNSKISYVMSGNSDFDVHY